MACIQAGWLKTLTLTLTWWGGSEPSGEKIYWPGEIGRDKMVYGPRERIGDDEMEAGGAA